jgi:MoxR-like ATPase
MILPATPAPGPQGSPRREAGAAPARAAERIAVLRRNVERVICGKDEVVRLAVVALLAKGHLLIEDIPGVGKTTLASALARSLGCTFRRIQFTSDLLPSDILGVTIFNPDSRGFEFKPGPIFTHVLLADEINRTTPKTQSALLEAMSEFRVSIDSVSRALPDPFFVLATQNPVEHHGTYPLPDSQLDRFLMRIEMGYPDAAAEKEIIVRQRLTHPAETLSPVLAAQEVVELQKGVREVRVEGTVLDYLLAVVTATRSAEPVELGVSPRGSLSLFRACQALALVEGRDYVLPDDVKALAAPVLAHRLILKGRIATAAGSRRATARKVVEEILGRTPVPL